MYKGAMNQKRRDKLKEAVSLLERAYNIVADIAEEESDALDNMPENLQSSDRYEKMESAIDELEEALQKISDANESIDSAMN